MNKQAHYNALFTTDVERLASELYRYENISDDVRWNTDKGFYRTTDFIFESIRYTIEMHNGNIVSVSRAKQ